LVGIESTWDKRNQGKAYGMIAKSYLGMYDCNESNVDFERELSIAKEINDPKLEAETSHGLGYNYGRVGDCDNATEYFEQELVALSELGDIVEQGRAHFAMGHELIVTPDGHHQEAIEMLQKALGISETNDDPKSLSWTLC